jgi:O-methyltransferase involved in polyketide biosynthesis
MNLTGEKATLLATLYGRALDARKPRPILGDTMAAEVVERMDFDFTKTGMRKGDDAAVALRARHIDGWVRDYLAAYPTATVLHIGCGLDSRVFRIDSRAPWFDVDYPDVIELRHELYPAREGYTMIGSSVTDPAWLEQVPADGPVLVVAEGLTMYLTEADGKALIARIVRRFPSGQFVFDGLSRRGIKMQKLNKPVQVAKATVSWGMDSGAELEAIDPRLRCVTALSAMDLDGYEELKPAYRLLVRLMKRFESMKNMAVFYRLEF